MRVATLCMIGAKGYLEYLSFLKRLNVKRGFCQNISFNGGYVSKAD